MKLLNLGASLLAVATTLGLSSAAHAVMIDFAANGGPSGQSSWSTTVDGVTVTVTPGYSGSTSSDVSLYWDSNDGFGVMGGGRRGSDISYENDEIEGNESITVTFSQAVQIVSIAVTDLFNETDNYGNSYLEQGSYSVDGSSGSFQANPSSLPGSTNGTKTVAINTQGSVLTLTAPGIVTSQSGWGWHSKTTVQNHEYSLAGVTFNVVSVPELSAGGFGSGLALLLGSALLLGDRRRRHAKRAE